MKSYLTTEKLKSPKKLFQKNFCHKNLRSQIFFSFESAEGSSRFPLKFKEILKSSFEKKLLPYSIP